MADGDGVLTIEIKNSRPVELSDLSTSLAAMGEAFKDFANSKGDPIPDNIRLYVFELRTGSIIAQLGALAEQAQTILDHAELLAGFYTNLGDVIDFFRGKPKAEAPPPSRQQAAYAASIVEPVAKDQASQVNITFNGPVTLQPIIVSSLEANAIQNNVGRYLGPSLPATSVRQDELLVLEQVKNSAKARTGDRGVIETISDRPVKLQFLSDEAKRKVLDLHENPFQCAFLVDVEVRTVGGKPALYRILDVKDVFPKP